MNVGITNSLLHFYQHWGVSSTSPFFQRLKTFKDNKRQKTKEKEKEQEEQDEEEEEERGEAKEEDRNEKKDRTHVVLIVILYSPVSGSATVGAALTFLIYSLIFIFTQF